MAWVYRRPSAYRLAQKRRVRAGPSVWTGSGVFAGAASITAGLFTRASIASVIDERGFMQFVTTNIARYTHDPATGAGIGWLYEPAATNLIPSPTFSSGWTANGACALTTGATGFADPIGSHTAASVLATDTTNSLRYLALPAGCTTGAGTYAYSVYLQSTATATNAWLQINSSTGASCIAYFDLSGGTCVIGQDLVAGFTGEAASIRNAGNGWWRCALMFTTPGGSAGLFPFLGMCQTVSGTGDNRSYTGVVGQGIYCWGAQLEAGSPPTSYISTSGSATRAADQGGWVTVLAAASGEIDGTSGISANGVHNPLGAATLAGAGGISASPVQWEIASGTFPGAAAISAQGTHTPLGAGSFAGIGGITGSPVQWDIARAEIDGTAAFSANGTHTPLGAGTFGGSAGITAAVVADLVAGATLAGTGGLTGTPVAALLASGEIDGSAGIVANGVHTPLGAGIFAGAGGISASPVGLLAASGELDGAGSLAAAAVLWALARAELDGTGLFAGQAAGVSTWLGSGTFAGTAGLVANAAAALLATNRIIGANALSGTPAPGGTNTVAASSAVAPPLPGLEVFAHTRDSSGVNNCGALWVNTPIAPAYAAQVWVYIPSAWAGAPGNIVVDTEQACAYFFAAPDLALRDQWQLLSVQTNFVTGPWALVLRADPAGVIYTAGWSAAPLTSGMDGTAGIAGQGVHLALGAGRFDAQTAIAANAHRVTPGSAVLAAQAGIAAAPVALLAAAAALAGQAGITAAPVARLAAQAALAGEAGFLASFGGHLLTASGLFAGIGGFSGAALRQTQGAGLFAGTAGLSGAPVSLLAASGSLTGAAGWTAQARAWLAASGRFAGAADIEAVAVALLRAAAALDGAAGFEDQLPLVARPASGRFDATAGFSAAWYDLQKVAELGAALPALLRGADLPGLARAIRLAGLDRGVTAAAIARVLRLPPDERGNKG